MNAKPTIDCFILDMDGTVVHTNPDIAIAANLTLEQLGFEPLPLETIGSYIGGGATVLMQRALGEHAAEYEERAVPLFVENYAAHPCDKSSLYPGVLEGLKAMKAAGCVVAIATQKVEAIAAKINEGLGIASYLDLVVGPESVTHRKPHPESVLRVVEHFGVRPERTVMVGDAVSDIQAARAAGVLSCAVMYGYAPRASLEAAEADYEIGAFDELFDLFDLGKGPGD